MPPTAKPAHKQTVRLPPDLWGRLQVAADADRRSVNQLIVVTLEAAYPGPSWVAENHPTRPLLYPQTGNASMDEDYLPGDGVAD